MQSVLLEFGILPSLGTQCLPHSIPTYSVSQSIYTASLDSVHGVSVLFPLGHSEQSLHSP